MKTPLVVGTCVRISGPALAVGDNKHSHWYNKERVKLLEDCLNDDEITFMCDCNHFMKVHRNQIVSVFKKAEPKYIITNEKNNMCWQGFLSLHHVKRMFEDRTSRKLTTNIYRVKKVKL